eukprot:COSAG01_NODE_910_length_12784_cov_15.136460_12_plen_192_part_00
MHLQPAGTGAGGAAVWTRTACAEADLARLRRFATEGAGRQLRRGAALVGRALGAPDRATLRPPETTLTVRLAAKSALAALLAVPVAVHARAWRGGRATVCELGQHVVLRVAGRRDVKRAVSARSDEHAGEDGRAHGTTQQQDDGESSEAQHPRGPRRSATAAVASNMQARPCIWTGDCCLPVDLHSRGISD